MLKTNHITCIVLSAFLMIVFNSCRKDDLYDNESDYPDWSENTHSENADLNYAVVFNQTEVLRFDIEIDADYWEEMENDLASNYGSSGPPGGGGPPPRSITSDYQPVWVPCSIHFDGIEWYKVGIRYKGNSSLESAYRAGINKLPFKLDFDQFEDDYPALANQRFYGFKQLNLKNNFEDLSFMREKVAADLFRQFGLASPQTAFCEVYIEYGEGSQYFGLYTLVEEVDNTVYKTQFAQNTGNLYKPENDAATFASGTYSESEMYLKTNLSTADYSDVEALYEVINSPLRTSDVEAWKLNLENVFNVNTFLKYLAANNVIQNWDTYGIMPHNYYLYNNPANNLLTWMPWDNNEAFQEGKQGGALSLSMSEVNNGWPLIRYIIDQDEYRETYETYLQEFIDDVFVPSEMVLLYSDCSDLLSEYAYAEESPYTFLNSTYDYDVAVQGLKDHVQTRNELVNAYLQNKRCLVDM